MVQILWYSLSVKEIRTEEEQKNVHESSEMGTVGFERSRGADCGGGDFFWHLMSVSHRCDGL